MIQILLGFPRLTVFMHVSSKIINFNKASILMKSRNRANFPITNHRVWNLISENDQMQWIAFSDKWQHEEMVKFWLTNSTCQSWKDQISDRCRKPSCRSSIGRDATSFRLCKLNRSSCSRKKPAPTWFHGCRPTNPRTETLPPFPGWQFTQCPIFITTYTQTLCSLTAMY